MIAWNIDAHYEAMLAEYEEMDSRLNEARDIELSQLRERMPSLFDDDDLLNVPFPSFMVSAP